MLTLLTHPAPARKRAPLPRQGRNRANTGVYLSHPPNPELSEQLFSRVRYAEDIREPRTKLAGIFSSLRVGLHELAQEHWSHRHRVEVKRRE